MSAPLKYPFLIGASWRGELHEPAMARGNSAIPDSPKLVPPVCDLASNLIDLIIPG